MSIFIILVLNLLIYYNKFLELVVISVGFIKNEYTSFYTSVIKEIGKIPLSGSDFVPQGCCSIGNCVVVACYDYDHEQNSILYVFQYNTVRRVYLDSKLHCGGIAYHKKTDSLFVTGVGYGDKSFINRYCGKDLLEAKDLSTIFVDKVTCVDNENLLYSTSAKHSSPSYLTVHDNNIYVGNYVDFSQFNEYKAVIKKYRILSNGDISVTNDIITNPFSNTQGISIIEYEGVTYYLFSRSFGRKRNSIINICTYDEKFKCINSVVLPSMLEQINNYKDGILAIFESCAKCYSKTCICNDSGVYYLDFSKLLSCDDDKKCFSRGGSLFVSDKSIDIKGNSGLF